MRTGSGTAVNGSSVADRIQLGEVGIFRLTKRSALLLSQQLSQQHRRPVLRACSLQRDAGRGKLRSTIVIVRTVRVLRVFCICRLAALGRPGDTGVLLSETL